MSAKQRIMDRDTDNGKTLMERLHERLVVYGPADASLRSVGARFWLVIAGMALVLLAPTLGYPLGHDEAIFLAGAERILDGGIHYRDVIDVKPPLIYHLYALAVVLFGSHDTSIRLFDLLVQLLTCLSMAYVVRRAGGSAPWAAVSVAAYCLLYTGLSYSGTTHAESMTGIVLMPMAALLLFGGSMARRAGVGALCGALFLLKFTLGAVLAVALAAEWIAAGEATFRQRMRRNVAEVAGFAAAVALLPIYLLLGGAVEDFLLMQGFLAEYAGINHSSIGGMTAEAVRLVPSFFAEYFSLAFTLLLVAGIAHSIGRSGSDRRIQERPRSLLAFCTLAVLALLATVVIEGKYPAYHFSRLYAPAAVLVGFAGVWVLRTLRGFPTDLYSRLVLAIALAGAVVFGPLPRYAFHAGSALAVAASDHTALDDYYDGGEFGFRRAELETVKEYLSVHRADGDRVFVLSGYGGLVHHILDTPVEFELFHSAFVIADFAPRRWKEATTTWVRQRRPAYILVQTSDSMPDITGSDATSEAWLLRQPSLARLIDSSYSVALRTPSFNLYRRR